MATDTSIPWTHAAGYRGITWNPTNGCDETGPECWHCYAMTVTHRFGGPKGHPRFQGLTLINESGKVTWNGELRLNHDRLAEPATWKEPRIVFVDSMSDLFHDKVPEEFILQVFDVMAANPRHIFQVLTKRAKRMRDFMKKHVESGRLKVAENIWLGVSVGLQESMWRTAMLQRTPAFVRFISAEPLIGPLDFTQAPKNQPPGLTLVDHLVGIDWVIAGFESGPDAREGDLAWARSIRDQVEGRASFFMKQTGTVHARRTNARLANGRFDFKGENPDNWDEDLRIRQMPKALQLHQEYLKGVEA